MIQQIRRRRQRRLARQSGQGMLEYAMAIVIIMGVFGVINNSTKKSIRSMWKVMAKDIAPACPGCTDSLPPELQ